jgi:transcriptional regulator
MKKTLIIEKRKKAKELRARGWSIRRVASSLVAGKDSVSKWDKMSDEAVERDERCWKKGRLRVHTEEEEKRIIEIRKELEREESFFFGADVVMRNYEHK